MSNTFETPQRQSATGIIVGAIKNFTEVIKATLIPILIFVLKAEARILSNLGLGLGLLALLVLIYSYFSYRRFTFFLDTEKQEFIIKKGVFNHSVLTIQLDKIQQVNINQSFIQQLIGVYSLQIDTPGGNAKEVTINSITQDVAYSLKEHLLQGKKIENETMTETEADPKPIIRLDFSTLFKIGLTSNYGSTIALLIGFAYALFHNAKDLLRVFDKDDGQVESVIESGINFLSIGIIIGALILLLLATNLIRTLIIYYDFNITKHRQSLLISTGLLTKKNTLLNPNKVQLTTYSQNYFQRKLDLTNLTFKQAISAQQADEDSSKAAVLQIPGCNLTERDQILSLIIGRIPSQETTFYPNIRFLNLPIFFKIFIPLAVFFTLSLKFDDLQSFYPFAIFYVIVGTFMIYRSYRNHQLKVSRDLIIKRSGIWDIEEEILFPHKIQSISTFQYPWHKSVDVGHVDIHTAAGVIHFKFGNYTEIKRLVNYWLYQVEHENKDWI